MAALMQSRTLDLFDEKTPENIPDRVSVIRQMPSINLNVVEDRRKQHFSYSMQDIELQQKILETSKEAARQQKMYTEQQHSDLMAMKVARRTERGPYMCHDCGKILKRSSSLSNHRLIHKNVKAFKCEKCGASFLRKSDLGKHYAIHTGSKPYICDICNKSFSQSSNMLTHKRRHSGVKPYKCDYCLKSFYRKVDVKRHEIVHSISEGE